MAYNVWIHDRRARSLLLHPMRGTMLSGIRMHEGPWTAEDAARLASETSGRLRFRALDGDLHVSSAAT